LKTKKPARKTLVKKLDTVFSIYIRQRKAIDDIAECVTCGKKDHWKKLQNGHFMSRKHLSTRWDEDNCQVQCAGCNVFKYGEQYKYSVWLESNLGSGSSDRLLQKSRTTLKIADFELIEMIEFYKNKNESY
jgi:5-methylcytosine-specific restriction endonuclease McrA|tara:strand:- start:1710 stop:2102 length:393 start_codon:yes stop_codon:yes gene_type:complete